MKKLFVAFMLVLFVSLPAFASRGKQIERLENSADVLKEIMDIPEGSIPKDLLEKAECIVIIPGLKKAALGIGGDYGRGELLCRLKDRGWSPPVMVSMTGGSIGFQLGGTSTDIFLLIMNRKGVGKLLESKVTLGGDASAAAGPKGRTAAAATDAQMHAEILCYARSRGLFAGVSLNGSVLKPSEDDNEDLYGKKIDARVILYEGGEMPGESAKRLVDELNSYSPRGKE